MWDDLFKYNSLQADSFDAGAILEETEESLYSSNGILFLTNNERQVDIIALLSEIMRRKREGQSLGVIASDLLNLKFPEVIPVRIRGLIGERVSSFRDLFNIALARTETVDPVSLSEGIRIAKAAVKTAIDILSGNGIVTLAPSAGRKISNRENWGNFLSLMLRSFVNTKEANSTLFF